MIASRDIGVSVEEGDIERIGVENELRRHSLLLRKSKEGVLK
jgi:hypothetical protein